MVSKNKPTVSVCIITYNQEEYISECIESIIKQRTKFPFEILIGEDDSNDNTRCICKEYAEKFPNKIRLFLRERKDSIYLNGIPTGKYNFIKTIQESKAKYIALCEGDDYWTDHLKLQKQIDFLENHIDYSICFHDVKIFDQDKNKFRNDTITREVPETTTIDDLAKWNFIHTPSVVFRNNFIIPDWFNKVLIGDWALYMIAVNNKQKIKKINGKMAVYRKHDKGIISKLHLYNIHVKSTLSSLEIINNNLKLDNKPKKIFQNTILKLKKIKLKNRFPILWILIRPFWYLYINFKKLIII